MKIPDYLEKVRDIKKTKQELLDFEIRVKDVYESGKIHAPVHLSKGNEEQLIEIFGEDPFQNDSAQSYDFRPKKRIYIYR